MKTSDLTLHPSANDVPKMRSEEWNAFLSDVQANGIKEAITIQTPNIILDGRHRWNAAKECGIQDIAVNVVDLSPLEQINHIIRTAVLRRHLSDDQRGALASRFQKPMSEAAKKERAKKARATQLGLSSTVDDKPKQDTRKQAAEQFNVSIKKVQNVNEIANQAPELVDSIANGELSIIEAKALATVEPEKRKEALDAIAEGEAPRKAMQNVGVQPKGRPSALAQSDSNEWYTPAKYLAAIHAVMGGIDIDPASNPIANETVQAKMFYTLETNGYDKEWNGRVFLNPPYGRDQGLSNQDIWSARLLQQFLSGVTTEAILLVNAVTDRVWFQPLWAYPICFTDHRIKFYNDSGEVGQPTHGNAFVYMGDNEVRFVEVFKQFGAIVRRIA